MRIGILFLGAFLLVLSGIALAETPVRKIDRPENIPSFLGYMPGELIVQFNLPAEQLKASKSQSGNLSLNVYSLDVIAEKYEVTAMRPLFPGAQPTVKNGKTFDLSGYHKVRFNPSYDLDEVMNEYLSDPNVISVEKNGIHSMYATPNDGYYSYQWHLNQTSDHDIDAPEAWDIEPGDASVIVAILDSGTRYYHPDLGGVNASPTNPGASRGNMWINNTELNGSSGVDDDGNGYVDDWIGWDFISSASSCWSGEDCSTPDNDPRDFNGHGTHTSGIFGMLTNDGYGMCGVAGGWGSGSQAEYGNGVKIMALRMGYSYNYLGQEYGVVLMDAAASAFYYAANNGAKIASCSWGSSNSGGIGTAATYFINSGGIIFVAAGNDGTQTADYLNGRGDCVSVAATDQNDAAASFTTYGTWVDISAPGVGIYSTYHDHTDPNTNYWAGMDGTSMATPMAAGVGALIWSKNPGWTNTQVKTQLFNSADNIDAYLSSTYIGKMGAGRINAYNAVNTGTPAPVAAFTGSPTSGCVPFTVNFTDQSTGDITSWSWNFGDGGTSTAQNPSHQYTTAATRTVTLTVTGPGGSDAETKTNYITASASPTANFTGSPTSGSVPLTVNFTNTSTGNPTSYLWNFGDTQTSTATNPSHTYTSAGTYTVTLTATNACGSDPEVKTNYITVTCTPPVANFSGSPTSGNVPLTVDFTDLSTGATSWSWNFGDGVGTSTAQNPNYTYTSVGTYTVTLTATNACGSDGETKTGYIQVTEAGGYATLPYSTGFEGGTFDQYWTTQSSANGRIRLLTTNTPHSGSYHMVMDCSVNGTYSQNEAWLHLNLAGKSQVDLTFWWKEFSDEDHTQDGVFFSSNGGSTFTKVRNLTGGSTTYQQIVMDVDALAATYGLSLTSTFVIKFQQYDNYTITTDGMAFDDISVVSMDVPPVAAFTGTPTSGIVPLQVTFTDQSTGNPTSWSWNFGDGVGTSTAKNPTYTYTSAGTYTVTLTATNAFGSDNEVKTNYITVSNPPPPVANFSGTPTSGTVPLTVNFTDLSTNNPTSWSWNFGDMGTSTAQNPSHTYTATGTYTVTLTATNAWGSDQEVKTAYITVNEPSSWTTITYDDFESGFGNYTDGGGDCMLYTYGTYAWEGNNAADIQDNSGVASSFYHTAGYNVSGYNEMEVEFYFIAISMDSNEDFWVQYYNGSAWQTVATFVVGTDFVNNSWYVATVTITDINYNFPTNAKLRFVCDASGNADDVYIDAITWRGMSGYSSAREPIVLNKMGDGIALLPEEFVLGQNRPNPFNPSTSISFNLTEASHVTLEVFNIVGQRVATLVDNMLEAGDHTYVWDGSNAASGVYLYRIATDDIVETKKMILMK